MFRNDTAGPGAMSFGHEAGTVSRPPTGRRTSWLARHLPVPIMVGGMVATIAWIGLVGWWVFALVRWSIG